MTVVVVDYGSGNLRSAAKALERVGARVEVTADPKAVEAADRIVLPGVGAFADCRGGLDAVPDLVETLRRCVLERCRPFLGVCVGMQLLATRGHEHGVHDGLGWIPGDVEPIAPPPPLKVPHMGWNELRTRRPIHPILKGLSADAHVYFVHSYQFRPSDDAACIADTDYGGPMVAAVARGNIAGTQFHPEKSQADGLRLLANFLAWRP
jgi:glutamine amidotransferase